MDSVSFMSGLAPALDPLKSLPNLKILSISNQVVPIDVSPLANLPALEQLDLAGTTTTNLDRFAGISIVGTFDSGVAETGNWQGFANTAAHEGDYRFLSGNDVGSVTYTLPALDPGVSFSLYATWPEHESRTSKARYELLKNDIVMATADIRQANAPAGFALGGRPWQLLTDKGFVAEAFIRFGFPTRTRHRAILPPMLLWCEGPPYPNSPR
jgi:hypothetical protein